MRTRFTFFACSVACLFFAGDANADEQSSGTVAGPKENIDWLLAPDRTESFHAVSRSIGEQFQVFRLIFAHEDIPAGTFLMELDYGTAESLAAEFGLDFSAAPPELKLQLQKLDLPRIGFYEKIATPHDENPTLALLDRWEFAYSVVDDKEIARGDLIRNYDVILFSTSDAISIGEKEIESLREMATTGGTLLFLGEASTAAIGMFGLPIANVVGGLSAEQFDCSDATLSVRIDPDHPLTWGMAAEGVVFKRGGPVLAVDSPEEKSKIAMPIRFAPSDVLQGGRLVGEEHLSGRGAIAEVKFGKGKIILIAFRPTEGEAANETMKILFNALYSAVRTSFGALGGRIFH